MSTTLRRPIFDAIQDETVRESLQWMYEYLVAQPLLKGQFEHFEITVTQAETGLKIPHSLGFIPKDIIHTSTVGAGSVTFEYDQFTATDVVITTSGALTVRFFGGSYVAENL